MKRTLAYMALLVLSGTLVFGITKIWNTEKDPKVSLYSQTFPIGDGFGYEIALQDKVLIRQEYIPILEGKKPFATSLDAQRTADKVISKLMKKESPILSVKELKELQIPDFN
ncbi:DUF4907 domain-containing protein [Arenibacter aquaticus]|nr:DUF4907 domain-containing protein [Arenibacter aquaticus]